MRSDIIAHWTGGKDIEADCEVDMGSTDIHIQILEGRKSLIQATAAG